MDIKLFKQYYSLLKNSHFGFDLSPVAVFNYLMYTCKKPNEKINVKCSPPLVTVYITRQCNLKCQFCLESKVLQNSNFQEYELTPNKYYEILKHPLIKKSLLINFCGGEPLLNKDILELISITKKNKKLSCLVTNGTLLKEKWHSLLKSGIDDIQVSIYNNTFNIFGDTLKFINKEKKLNASYVLLKSDLNKNQKIIEEVVDFIACSGFKSLKFNLCSSNKCNNFIDEMLKEEDTDKYEQFKNKILKKYKNIDIFFPKIPLKNSKKQKKCKLPWSVLQVDAKGHYGVCCLYPPDVLGSDNILNNNWGNIINSEEFCKWRKVLLSKDDKIPINCKDCYHLIGSYSSNL